MQPIKMQIPGMSPGIYSLDFVLSQVNFIDSHGRHDLLMVNKKHVRRNCGHRKEVRVSHAESCRRWRVNNPEKYKKANDNWNAYNRGLTGFRRLFGDDNKTIKHRIPKHPRNCLFCGMEAVEWRNSKYVCSMCLCNNVMGVA